MTFYILGELVDKSVTSTKQMKMSRRPTILEHFSILDVHYNLNFLGVDVKGRCSFIFSDLYCHQIIYIKGRPKVICFMITLLCDSLRGTIRKCNKNITHIGELNVRKYFFYVGSFQESIFLTTIHGLYFSHHYAYQPYARAPNTYFNYIFMFKFE